jgi:hypothetical protein
MEAFSTWRIREDHPERQEATVVVLVVVAVDAVRPMNCAGAP